MRDDQIHRLLRNAAAAGLAREISGEPVRWEEDAQFRLEDLPVDELPWHGVVVSVAVTLPRSGRKVKAPFFVWMADGDSVRACHP